MGVVVIGEDGVEEAAVIGVAAAPEEVAEVCIRLLVLLRSSKSTFLPPLSKLCEVKRLSRIAR